LSVHIVGISLANTYLCSPGTDMAWQKCRSHAHDQHENHRSRNTRTSLPNYT